MNVFQPLINDLREKRLWPVVIVLVAALVAVPVLLAKPAPKPRPAIAAIGAGATTSPISGLPVVTLSSTPQFSHLPGPGRDPFTQQMITTSNQRDGLHDVLPPRAAPVAHHRFPWLQLEYRERRWWWWHDRPTGSSTTTTPATTPNHHHDHHRRDAHGQPRGLTSTESYDVTIAITKPNGGLNTIDPVERLSAAPEQASSRCCIELGVLKGGSAVLFVVAAGNDAQRPANVPARRGSTARSSRWRRTRSRACRERRHRPDRTSPTSPSPASHDHRTSRQRPQERVRRQVSKVGRDAAQSLALRRAVAVPVRAECRRVVDQTQPDSGGS